MNPSLSSEANSNQTILKNIETLSGEVLATDQKSIIPEQIIHQDCNLTSSKVRASSPIKGDRGISQNTSAPMSSVVTGQTQKRKLHSTAGRMTAFMVSRSARAIRNSVSLKRARPLNPHRLSNDQVSVNAMGTVPLPINPLLVKKVIDNSAEKTQLSIPNYPGGFGSWSATDPIPSFQGGFGSVTILEKQTMAATVAEKSTANASSRFDSNLSANAVYIIPTGPTSTPIRNFCGILAVSLISIAGITAVGLSLIKKFSSTKPTS